MSLPPPPHYPPGLLPYASTQQPSFEPAPVAPGPVGSGAAAGAVPQPSGTRPRSVKTARVAGLIAVIGALLNGGAFVTWVISDATNDRYDYGTSTYVAMTLTSLFLLLFTTAAPWGSMIGASGYSGGRAVLWVFGPLSLLATAVGAIGNSIALGQDEFPTSVKFLGVVGLVGAAACTIGLGVAMVAWIVPGSRRYLAEHRRPGREGRGRMTLVVQAAMGALGVLLLGATFVLLVVASKNYETPEWRTYDDSTPGYFIAGMLFVATALVAEVALVAGALITRFTRLWWVRTGTFVVGTGSLFALVLGAFFVARSWSDASRDLTPDGSGTAEAAAMAALFLVIAAALLHVAAVLVLAMPSVSAWVASRPTSSGGVRAGVGA
ncbi:hypothetical protein [Cryptosporangium sp. NPDC051539]|uniref:hypothetical protein n=1 Tax=Cryptosporangium sp. NPDC051539 TaxID=3363962 RepID=UPI0037A30A69